MRPIDADFVVYAAESEFAEEDAAKVRWLIAHIPTIDAKPVRHGRWMKIQRPGTRCWCSECKSAAPFGTEHNYCPSCGAKMRGENECSDG